MPGHTLIGFGLGNYHNWPLIDIRLFERDLAARQFHFESIQKCFKSLFALLLGAETEHFFGILKIICLHHGGSLLIESFHEFACQNSILHAWGSLAI